MLLQAIYLTFSGNATGRGYSNCMEERVASLDTEAKKWKHAEKVAVNKAKKAEDQAAQAEDARKKAEEARKKAEDDLATTWSEHSHHLQEVLPATLEQAR